MWRWRCGKTVQIQRVLRTTNASFQGIHASLGLRNPYFTSCVLYHAASTIVFRYPAWAYPPLWKVGKLSPPIRFRPNIDPLTIKFFFVHTIWPLPKNSGSNSQSFPFLVGGTLDPNSQETYGTCLVFPAALKPRICRWICPAVFSGRCDPCVDHIRFPIMCGRTGKLNT